MTPATRSWLHFATLAALIGLIALISPALDNPRLLMSSLTHNTFYDCCIAVILAVSLNLILGLTGQFSLGHAGFMAVGAYTAAVITGKPEFFLPQLSFWHAHLGLSVPASFTCMAIAGMLAAMLLCAFLGLLVGLPTLRLRGDYLAIATLGFGEIVATIIGNSEYLGRTFGLRIDNMRQLWWAEGGKNTPFGPDVIAYNNNTLNFISSFWMLLAVLVTILIVRNIKYSTTGRALLAIREDPVASEAVGIPTTRYKIAAFVIGAALAGLAGALYSQYQALNPNGFRFMYSTMIVLYVILGGQGSITGSALAAIFLTLVPVIFQRNTLLDPAITEKWRMVAYALLIILSMLFMRHGIFGRYEITDLAQWLYRRLRKPPPIPHTSPAPAAPYALPIENRKSKIENPPSLLSAHDLSMQFGGLKAVDSFSLALNAGELVGLIGPNGAGKTTVFNVLTGVYRATSGQVDIADRSARHLRPHSISKRGVARTFQNIRLFANLSVLDNVQIAQHMHHKQGIPAAILRTPAFFREEDNSRKNALDYLALFHLDHLADACASSLSYGDQRRLEIARALATRPRVLLLDEPAAGMNPTEKRSLMDMIRSLRQRFGLAVLLIEHDMKVIMGVCERIVVLDYGKTIATGTPEEIRRNPAVIAAYLGAAAKEG
ncbi:MAG TPA: branched-chain amino acid ABC transporter ATP-binding protein/permease [Phycisphaerae bacterium]|nr:branched-chain amino acid ABC transporter ATP-binding protein/permease [Phycisphaerae bacterium]